jgi:hypothetical protein
MDATIHSGEAEDPDFGPRDGAERGIFHQFTPLFGLGYTFCNLLIAFTALFVVVAATQCKSRKIPCEIRAILRDQRTPRVTSRSQRAPARCHRRSRAGPRRRLGTSSPLSSKSNVTMNGSLLFSRLSGTQPCQGTGKSDSRLRMEKSRVFLMGRRPREFRFLHSLSHKRTEALLRCSNGR